MPQKCLKIEKYSKWTISGCSLGYLIILQFLQHFLAPLAPPWLSRGGKDSSSARVTPRRQILLRLWRRLFTLRPPWTPSRRRAGLNEERERDSPKRVRPIR